MDKVILGSSLIYYLFSFLGISYIHLFIIVCSLFTLLIIWKSNAIQENDVSLAVLLFSLIALGISLPLFENDHFRYFFEGKLFLEGINIYRLSPQEFLLGAETIFRDNLGFPMFLQSMGLLHISFMVLHLACLVLVAGCFSSSYFIY